MEERQGCLVGPILSPERVGNTSIAVPEESRGGTRGTLVTMGGRSELAWGPMCRLCAVSGHCDLESCTEPVKQRPAQLPRVFTVHRERPGQMWA